MDVILLGEIEDKINGVDSKIDAKSSEIISGINSIKPLVATNNTGSETGTLSQKLTSIIINTKTNNTASETGTLSQKISSLITINKSHGWLERKTAGSQNWTCPTGVSVVYAVLIGGGGGGEGSYSSATSGEDGVDSTFCNLVAHGGRAGYYMNGGYATSKSLDIILHSSEGTKGYQYDGRYGGSGGGATCGFGAGGKGGSSASSSYSGGGGGGAGSLTQGLCSVTPGTSYTLTVGAGGAGGAGNAGGSAGQSGYVKIIW